uniref:Putative secreted protein n=1 Tax=Anopheles aquasalis TaxID=42839 RepID=T1DN49_ANOAQ
MWWKKLGVALLLVVATSHYVQSQQPAKVLCYYDAANFLIEGKRHGNDDGGAEPLNPGRPLLDGANGGVIRRYARQ